MARVLAGPLDVYYAPVGTARPSNSDGTHTPNKTSPAPWIIIGDNMKGPDGMSLDPSRSYTYERVMNQTHAIDAFISQSDLKFSLPLKDMRMDALRLAFNNNAVSRGVPTATIAGVDEMPLDIGHDSVKLALLVVGRVPYANPRSAARMVWYLPKANLEGPGSIAMKLAEASMYTLNFVALWYDSTLGVGRVSIERTAPTT